MKKLLVVLLSAMMVFAFATTAFAGQYSDIADLSNNTQDAISKLSALEIISGYPDGSFKPEGSITRAEFAKMACVAAGMKDSADILINTASQFSDVKAGEWYTGYINLAVSQGFVKGYTDGTYKPNATISNAEVLTVILRILGYNDNLPGPWPVDYVAKAGALEITSGIDFTTSANATRADVAEMIDNALEEDIVMWDKDVEEFVEKYAPTKSLLVDSFKGQVVEDAMITEWNVDDFDKGNLRLVIGGKGYVVTANTVISDDLPVYDINGMICDIIYKYDKDLEKEVVKFVDVTSTNVVCTKASVMENGKIKLGDKQYTVADGVTIPANVNVFYKAYVDEDGIVYNVLADYQKDQNEGSTTNVVDEYFESTERLTFKQGASLTLANKDVLYLDEDGKVIDAAELAEFDIVKYFDSKNDVDYVVFVEEWKEATLDATSTGKVRLAGNNYPFIGSYYEDGDAVSADQDYIGTNVKYATNAANQVIAVIYTETGLGNSIYGIIVNAADYDVFGTGNTYLETLTVFTEDGKTVKYDVEADEIALSISGSTVQTQVAGNTVNLQPGDLVKIRLNADGEVHAISAHANLDYQGQGVTAKVDDKNGRVTLGGKTYNIESSIIAFDVDFDTDGTVDEVALISAEDLAEGDIDGDDMAYFTNSNNDGIAAIAIVDYSADRDDFFGFINRFGQVTADIDNGIVLVGDNTVYENVNNATVAKYEFVRYEISGDDIIIKNNVGIKNWENLAGTIDRVNGGIYYVSGLNGVTEFTIEEDTQIYEVTMNANGGIYDVKADATCGTGDKVYVALNDDPNADAFEAKEAMYIIVVADVKADASANQGVAQDTTISSDNSVMTNANLIKVAAGKCTKAGYIQIDGVDYQYTSATTVTGVTGDIAANGFDAYAEVEITLNANGTIKAIAITQ